MAGLRSLISGVSKLLSRNTVHIALPVRNAATTSVTTTGTTSVATTATNPKYQGMDWDKWPDHKMKRDVKRRRLVKEYAPERLRLLGLKRNDVLPVEIREIASQEMSEIPRQAALRQIVYRCKLTSRPRGVVYRWGLSRIVFRHLADYNKMAGVLRARW